MIFSFSNAAPSADFEKWFASTGIEQKAKSATYDFVEMHKPMLNPHQHTDLDICRYAIAAVFWKIWKNAADQSQWMATGRPQRDVALEKLKGKMKEFENEVKENASLESDFEKCFKVFFKMRSDELTQRGMVGPVIEKAPKELKEMADNYYGQMKKREVKFSAEFEKWFKKTKLEKKAEIAKSHFEEMHELNQIHRTDLDLCRYAIASVFWKLWDQAASKDQWVATGLEERNKVLSVFVGKMKEFQKEVNEKAKPESTFEECLKVFNDVRIYEMGQKSILDHKYKTKEELEKVADFYYEQIERKGEIFFPKKEQLSTKTLYED